MKGSVTKKAVWFFEVFAILVIAALIGVMAFPKRAPDEAGAAADAPARGTDVVRAAHASAIARLKRFPTVKELSAFVQETNASATPGGIELSFDQSRLTIPTYSDSNCTRPTLNVDEPVACLGNL